MPPDYTVPAASDADAAERFAQFQAVDPLPSVPPSLLNSADVLDYVRLTGMLHPFHPDKLKSASYEAAIRGRCIRWDEAGSQKETDLDGDRTFTLDPNSIAFVQVEPMFRLPAYMAIRFNLKITHVHRGLLLGTGPLVDPGFVGKLLIPLHNLTTNTYTFRAGEDLIWIEFTKTSPHQSWHRSEDTHPRSGQYVPFPQRKKNLSPEEYFAKASQNNPIRSSIPAAIQEGRQAAQTARDAATNAAEEARRLQRRAFGIGLAGALAVGVALAGVTYQTWSLIQETWTVATSAKELSRQAENILKQQSTRIENLERARGELLNDIAALKKTLSRPAKQSPDPQRDK